LPPLALPPEPVLPPSDVEPPALGLPPAEVPVDLLGAPQPMRADSATTMVRERLDFTAVELAATTSWAGFFISRASKKVLKKSRGDRST
jgi:hypothetical protein